MSSMAFARSPSRSIGEALHEVEWYSLTDSQFAAVLSTSSYAAPAAGEALDHDPDSYLSCPSTRVTSPCGDIEDRKRTRSSTEKDQHSKACKNKDRLTLSEKLQIIYLHQLAPMHERKGQGDLAIMFRKSRMTISKVLRKDNVAKIKALAASGVRMEAKRCRKARYPEFERCLFRQLGDGLRPVIRHEVLTKARELLREMNITDMKVDSKWCTRFIRQHDLSIGALDADMVSIDATMSLLTAPNKSMRAPMCAPVPASADHVGHQVSIAAAAEPHPSLMHDTGRSRLAIPPPAPPTNSHSYGTCGTLHEFHTFKNKKGFGSAEDAVSVLSSMRQC